MKEHFFDLREPVFFAVLMALAGAGLVMVYSASSVLAYEKTGSSLFYFSRQALFVLIGLATMFFLQSTNYHKWLKWSPWILVLSLLALFATYIPAFSFKAGGASRWISFGEIRAQPSEFVKLAVVLFLSRYLVVKRAELASFNKCFLPIFLGTVVIAALIYRQPDFGSAVLVMALAGTLFFLAGMKLRYMVTALIFALPVIYYALFSAEYRRRRVLAFLNPWEDIQNAGYQIIQSFLAFYNGGVAGRGLGNGTEKLYYLPEAHTDFVFSVIAEELGFLGVAVIVILFAVFVWRGLKIAIRAIDAEGYLLAMGATCLIGMQAILNMAVVTGLLPTKGLPLPFISHGGSSTIATFLACGLILSVARRTSIYGSNSGALPDWHKRWRYGR